MYLAKAYTHTQIFWPQTLIFPTMSDISSAASIHRLRLDVTFNSPWPEHGLADFEQFRTSSVGIVKTDPMSQKAFPDSGLAHTLVQPNLVT